MTVVSRATSRRTRPGNNRRTRNTPRAGRGPTRGRTRSTRRYLVPALLSRTSDGFTKATRPLAIARTAACVLSLTALTGLVALLLAALVTRLLVGPLRP